MSKNEDIASIFDRFLTEDEQGFVFIRSSLKDSRWFGKEVMLLTTCLSLPAGDISRLKALFLLKNFACITNIGNGNFWEKCIRNTIYLISDGYNDNEVKLAVNLLRNLACYSKHVFYMVKQRIIFQLFPLLKRKNDGIITQALLALGNIAIVVGSGKYYQFIDVGVYYYIYRILRKGKDEHKEYAARILSILTAGTLGRWPVSPDVIILCMGLLQSQNKQSIAYLSKIFCNITRNEDSLLCIIENDGIVALIKLLYNDNDIVCDNTVKTLYKITEYIKNHMYNILTKELNTDILEMQNSIRQIFVQENVSAKLIKLALSNISEFKLIITILCNLVTIDKIENANKLKEEAINSDDKVLKHGSLVVLSALI